MTPIYPNPRCADCGDKGCYRCCDRCNYDTHLCPGCGENLKHGIEVCDDCIAFEESEAKPYPNENAELSEGYNGI